MAKTIRIANVGPGLSVQGGISRLIALIGAHLPSHIGFRLISTFTKFTGDKGATPSERGSRLGQAYVFSLAFVQVLVLALRRRTVFHVHFAGRGSLLRKGIICTLLRSLRCQYVVHSHAADTDLFKPWLPPWCRRTILWGISGAGRVIVLTQFWHDYYSSLLSLPASRVLLLPNPADLPQSVPDRSQRDGLRLLFLGRIGTRKGAFDLIYAFANLPENVRSRCHLTMAGDGETNEAKALATQLGCSNCISIPGWIGPATVEQLLVESDVLVLPSYAEGMAMALVEAMSWGLAIVTTGVGGAGEFLDQGRNCMLVTPGDIGEISNAISELARNPALRERIGRAARETVSRFSIHSYIATLSGVYEDLAKRLPERHSPADSPAQPSPDLLTHIVSHAPDHANSAPPLVETMIGK
jgi:glycosyltransferase involved in cell wall biosynthesis